MKTVWIALLAAASAWGQATESRPVKDIPWRSDLAAARAEAASEGRPLCVVFRCEA